MLVLRYVHNFELLLNDIFQSYRQLRIRIGSDDEITEIK